MNNTIKKIIGKEEVIAFRKYNKENQIEPGHAFVGYWGKDEDEKIITLTPEERYANTMVIGPTASGKTSQALIPMIWSDLNNYTKVNNKPMGITVLEPMGTLVEKVHAMVILKNIIIDKEFENGTYDETKHGQQRKVLYFNPILNNCPYFNPFIGDEDDVVENICYAFNQINKSFTAEIQSDSEILLRRAVKLLKRLLGDDATLLDLNTLVWNVNDEGRKNYVMKMKTLKTMPDGSEIRPDIEKENGEIIDWFLNDYYVGIGGSVNAPKTYMNTSNIRTQLEKITSNKYLRKVLNPPKPGELGYEESLKIEKINFDETLENGHIVLMNTCKGKLRDLSSVLGHLLLSQFQTSMFKRTGNKSKMLPNMLYIDEFQCYVNPRYVNILSQGREYNIVTTFATQARAQLTAGVNDNREGFLDYISANIRNEIIFSGLSYADSTYFANKYGVNLDRIMDIYQDRVVYNTIKSRYRDTVKYANVKHLPKDIDNILDLIIEEYDNQKDINDIELDIIKSVRDTELTTEASKVLDPMAAYESAMTPMEDDFDLDLDNMNLFKHPFFKELAKKHALKNVAHETLIINEDMVNLNGKILEIDNDIELDR